MRIGEVARRAGVRSSRIRYYESVGLLPEPERVSGQRVYDEGVLKRLAVIDVSQRAGLSLAEIRELTAPARQEVPAGERIRAIAARKLPEVEALIGRAEAMRRWLDLASICDCESLDVCALFDEHALPPAPHR